MNKTEVRKYIDCCLRSFYHDAMKNEEDNPLPYKRPQLNNPNAPLRAEDNHLDSFLREGSSIERALDFGCGDGRWIRYFSEYIKEVDGCDIAPCSIKKAKATVLDCGSLSRFFDVEYETLDNIPDDHYDLIYSITVFQYIPVYDLRRSYFSEFLKKLRVGGYISIQMGCGDIWFVTDKGGWDYAEYHENRTDIRWTNSRFDVKIADVEVVKQDLIDIGYHDVVVNVVPNPLWANKENSKMMHENRCVLQGFRR